MASELATLRGEVGAIIAQREKKRNAPDFSIYRDDPVGFLRDVLHCDPWDKQCEMATAVRDHPRVAIVSANSIGKDWLMARLALWWIYARNGFVIFTSVTDRQARGITMKEVRRAFLGTPELDGELFQMELRRDDTSGLIAFTSDSIERLVGWHHPRLLLCLSEAQGLEPDVFEAAFACATGDENVVAGYGNPTVVSGAFHTAATSENWHTIVVSALEHPNIITGREEIPGGPSQRWIDSMAAEYGRDSSIFRSRVLSEWPDESIEGLVRRSWMLAAFQRHAEHTLDATAWAYVPPNARGQLGDKDAMKFGYSPLLSLDVARYGPDHSVCAVVRGPVVESLISWHGLSTVESADKIIEHAERLWTNRRCAPPRLVIDESGVGGGTVDFTRRRTWHVEPFNGGSKATDPKRYLNLRAQAFWRFRELLERNQIALPRDEQLLEEALAIEWFTSPSGAIQIVSKDDLKKVIGRSPDKLDAVVMGLGATVGRLRHEARWGRIGADGVVVWR
jgi:phage terminase large subunit